MMGRLFSVATQMEPIMTRNLLGIIAASTLFVAYAAPVVAQTQELRVANGRATFTSDAALETINGTSTGVSGSVTVDLANPGAASGTVRVPVSSLRTGLDLRDEHLRGPNWLDAGTHPDITLTVTAFEGASDFTGGERVSFQIRGTMTIRGTSRPVTIRAQGQLRDGSLLLRARWRIRLNDYGVSIPATVQAKVSNEIVLSVNIRATAG